MTRVYKIYLLLVSAVVFLLYFGFYFVEQRDTMEDLEAHLQGDAIRFSVESGYYTEAITVSLKKDLEIPRTADIYYTLDGNDPTKESTRYSGKILLESDEELQVYPLKVVVYYRGEYSDVFERTYIIGSRVDFDDLDIISITSDSGNLYDYETGIFVPGKTYDENVSMGTEGSIGGNYNQRSEEWIRNAYMTVINSNGHVEMEQKVGLGVSGGTSALNDVKSLKIYAIGSEDSYDKKITMNYYDGEKIKNRTYSYVDEYASIRLRAGSQDIYNGNIRSAVVSRLAQESGFDGCTDTKRCIVFLNGEFYGIFDIQQNYSDSHLAKRFGLEHSEYIEKVKWADLFLLQAPEVTELIMANLDMRENREALERVVDMDNYLLYYAISILCNNTDWPANNFEMWRYVGERREENVYTDGRWRFLLYDMDLAWPSYELFPEFFEGCREDTFQAIMESKYRGGVSFGYVMQSKYYRDKFITIISDLFNTSFSSENVTNIMEEENAKISNVREVFYNEEFVEFSEQSVLEMIKQAERREKEMSDNFSAYFGIDKKYELALETTKGVAVLWNNIEVWGDSSYVNEYYYDVDIVMSAEIYPGYTFSYWVVNGEKLYDTELLISNQWIENDMVEIKAVASPVEEECLIISGISAKGDADWVRVSNVGKGTVECGQYYLTDNMDELMLYRLPDIKLAPGESVIINGSKNFHEIGDYICNFSLKAGETLILSDGIHHYDEVIISKMTKIEYYGRYDNSNVWKFFLKEHDNRQ